MDNAAEAREATPEEWAERLFAGPVTQAMVAEAIKYAIARGERREREVCHRLALDHALTIDDRGVAETPYGRHMTEQQCIDVASSQRHVAQYVGVLIHNRNPQPPPGFRIEQ